MHSRSLRSRRGEEGDGIHCVSTDVYPISELLDKLNLSPDFHRVCVTLFRHTNVPHACCPRAAHLRTGPSIGSSYHPIGQVASRRRSKDCRLWNQGSGGVACTRATDPFYMAFNSRRLRVHSICVHVCSDIHTIWKQTEKFN